MFLILRSKPLMVLNLYICNIDENLGCLVCRLLMQCTIDVLKLLPICQIHLNMCTKVAINAAKLLYLQNN